MMTKKMPALFAAYPPQRPLDSLDAIVDDWIYRFGAKGVQKNRRDLVVEYTAAAGSFPAAVRRACASREAPLKGQKVGKMHNHQSRVTEEARDAFAEALIENKAMRRSKTFDELHDFCEAIAPEGIGPVTTYDVATRVAAYMKLDITSLYLHAGVRIGWRLLHGQRSPNVARIERNDLPLALRRIPADECEDMLCAYREFLKPWLEIQT
jgi:hypothetical protein